MKTLAILSVCLMLCLVVDSYVTKDQMYRELKSALLNLAQKRQVGQGQGGQGQGQGGQGQGQGDQGQGQGDQGQGQGDQGQGQGGQGQEGQGQGGQGQGGLGQALQVPEINREQFMDQIEDLQEKVEKMFSGFMGFRPKFLEILTGATTFEAIRSEYEEMVNRTVVDTGYLFDKLLTTSLRLFTKAKDFPRGIRCGRTVELEEKFAANRPTDLTKAGVAVLDAVLSDNECLLEELHDEFRSFDVCDEEKLTVDLAEKIVSDGIRSTTRFTLDGLAFFVASHKLEVMLGQIAQEQGQQGQGQQGQGQQGQGQQGQGQQGQGQQNQVQELTRALTRLLQSN